MMRGRDFLDTANRLSQLKTESDWRSATSRAYYALYLECRDLLRKWGFFVAQLNSHRDVYQYLMFPNNVELKQIAHTFQNLSGNRNRADYDLAPHPNFAMATESINDVNGCRIALALLDAIDADPARRAQAIADIRAVFP